MNARRVLIIILIVSIFGISTTPAESSQKIIDALNSDAEATPACGVVPNIPAIDNSPSISSLVGFIPMGPWAIQLGCII